MYYLNKISKKKGLKIKIDIISIKKKNFLPDQLKPFKTCELVQKKILYNPKQVNST